MFTFVVIIYNRNLNYKIMKKVTEKNDVISVRVDTKTKNKLYKLAVENRREFSDFIRLVLTDVADGKVKIPL